MKHVFLVFPEENVREQQNICFPGKMFPLGTYHGKTENSGCKIKCFAPSRLRSVRKHKLWFKAKHFSFLHLSPVQLCGYTLQRVVWPPPPRQIYSFVFIHKIFIREVCVDGEHAPSVLLKMSWFWLEMLFRLQTVNITNHTRGKITCMWMKGTSWLSFGHIKGDKRSLQS